MIPEAYSFPSSFMKRRKEEGRAAIAVMYLQNLPDGKKRSVNATER